MKTSANLHSLLGFFLGATSVRVLEIARDVFVGLILHLDLRDLFFLHLLKRERQERLPPDLVGDRLRGRLEEVEGAALGLCTRVRERKSLTRNEGDLGELAVPLFRHLDLVALGLSF